MGNRDTFELALARNLAYRIVCGLNHHPKLVEDRELQLITITGALPLAEEGFSTRATARCIFKLNSSWPSTIPEVTCLEPWLRRKSPEWHAGHNGVLCYEFSLYWARELPIMVEKYTHGLTADWAARWLLHSTRLLLNKHLFAFRNGVTEWPRGWDYWPHDVEAARKQLEKIQLQVVSQHDGLAVVAGR